MRHVWVGVLGQHLCVPIQVVCFCTYSFSTNCRFSFKLHNAKCVFHRLPEVAATKMAAATKALVKGTQRRVSPRDAGTRQMHTSCCMPRQEKRNIPVLFRILFFGCKIGTCPKIVFAATMSFMRTGEGLALGDLLSASCCSEIHAWCEQLPASATRARMCFCEVCGVGELKYGGGEQNYDGKNGKG